MGEAIEPKCLVTNASDNLPGSLRAAIGCAIAKEQNTTIEFDMVGGAPYEIKLASPLPALINANGYSITVDGPLLNKVPAIRISPNENVAITEPFLIGAGSQVSNFIFSDFTQTAVKMRNGAKLINSKFERNRVSILVENTERNLVANSIDKCLFSGGTYRDIQTSPEDRAAKRPGSLNVVVLTFMVALTVSIVAETIM
jgi:hypothetical protein